MSTILDVIDDCAVTAGMDEATKNTLVAALQEREDKIREDLHVIAMQLGTFPEFVAFAFAEVGLGTPPSEEAKEMLHRQFHERMNELQQQFAEAGMGPPEGVVAIANNEPLPENLPPEVRAEISAARATMGWCDHGRRLDECDDCRE